MRRILETFVKYPFYANLVIGVLLLAGIFSYSSMKKSFFPERPTRMIYATVVYPGASPIEMEEGIVVRLEEAIRGIPGIKEITSSASENFCRVAVETTGKFNIDETLQEVKNSIDGITTLPVDAERPVVFKQRSTTPAMRIGLSGNANLMALKDIAYRVEDDFLASGLISQISIAGYTNPEISIEISEESLLRYGLTLSDVSQAVARTNRDITGGEIRNENHSLLIRARNRSVNPDQISKIVIRANSAGQLLSIGDVATVKYQFQDIPKGTWINGKPGISISINKLITEDLEDISIFVRKYIDEFNLTHSDVKLHLTFDYLDMLESRLNLLLRNGGMGLFLVVITLALFLSFRMSLWVAWGIPASFLGMFVVASLYGITINMISLFGMILVVGILVDDGIVIGENIFTHFEMGKSPHRAAIDGTMEVMPAVLTSVATTIVAFIPLLLIEGQLEFLFEMAFVVIFTLVISMAEAFFVLPAHLGTSHVLRRKTNHENFGNRVRNRLEKYISFLRDRSYGRVLKFVIKHRVPAMFVPLVVILITVGLFRGEIIQSTFFPNIPPDSFDVNVAFTPGEGEKQTFDFLKKFEVAVWQVNTDLKTERNDTSDYVIYTFLNMGSSFDGQESGSHAGNVSVNLRNMEGINISAFEIASRVRNKIGKIPEADRFSVAGRNRWGKPVSVSLLGNNLSELKIARDELVTELEKLPDLTEVMDNDPEGAQEIRIKLKPAAYALGIDYFTLLSQIRDGFFGAQSQRLQQGRDEIRVWVRFPRFDREQIGQLDQVKIKTKNGSFPFSELATYEIERGPVIIQHYNGKREIRVEADVVNPDKAIPPLLQLIENDILPPILAQHPGVRYEFQGQQKVAAESGQSMAKFFVPAFIIMVIIIMIEFRSFGQALIIVLLIPLGYIGAAWGHLIQNIPISMLSAWGMVALTGVIVNDSVVFIQKFNQLVEEGTKVVDAVYMAGISRFRAIVLTTLTTTFGLFPIVLETSRQAQFLIPMAVSLAYGVLFGTFFILLFLPLLVLALNDARVLWAKIWNNKTASREEVEKGFIYAKRKLED